jgi:uncharacterized protein
MIIDCHVHLNNYHVEEKAPTEEHLRRLREQMEKHRLDHVFVLSSYTVNPDRPSAARLLDVLKGDGKIHLVEGLGVTNDDQPVDWENVGARLREGLTRGLKIYPGYEHVYPYDKAFQPAFDLASKYKVPVMIHTGDTYAPTGKLKYAHPLHVDEVAVDWPDVNFVICHLGNPWFRDTAELLYKNHNVYADISGLVLEDFSAPLEEYLREELEDLLLYSGEMDKILYGTDWPLVKMGPYLRFVEQLELEPEHRRLLMGENAARLFRLSGGAAPASSSVHLGRGRSHAH